MWLNETPGENNSKLKKIISLYNEIIPYINCTDVWIPGQNISNIKRCIIGGDGNIIWDQWDYLETTHEDMIKKLQNEWILDKNMSLLHCTVLVFDNDKHFIISTDNIQNCKIPNNVLELSFILKELWKVESKVFVLGCTLTLWYTSRWTRLPRCARLYRANENLHG